jgi:hypothetical protein
MNPSGNFPKNLLFFVVSVAKAKNNIVLCLYICVGECCPVFGNFCMDIYGVDSDEAMKRGDEALNASLLQFLSIVKRFITSSLQFLLSIKHFIAVNFYRERSFNASSPLLLKRNSSLYASSPLLFKLLCPPLPFGTVRPGSESNSRIRSVLK